MGKKQQPSQNLLGDFAFQPFRFEHLKSILSEFQNANFSKINHKQKSEKVNRALLELIFNAPSDVFLLIAIVEYIDQINREDILINYTLSSFEIWLNQFSKLSEEDNYHVRGKIVGKWIPRDSYQVIFPVGMGKIHPGSHFITAHSSPDLDTTVSSFWGWIDAFGARVSEGLHIWNVPGGAPASSIEVGILFYTIFGQNIFHHLAKDRSVLALSSLELMTQRGVVQIQPDQSSLLIDHERSQKAVILVDPAGYYLGDWRSFDVEGVRQVVMLLNNCIRWFENYLHLQIISLFAKKELVQKDLPAFVKEVFGITIKESDHVQEFTEKQLRHMETYLKKVLKVEKGLEATFAEFAKDIQKIGLTELQSCIEEISSLGKSDLFDNKGKLIEDRPKIFHVIEETIFGLSKALQTARHYTERLDVALSIKTQVYGFLPQVVSYRDDVDELRSKMANYPYLTVTSADQEGKMIPLGVVRSRDLQQPILGTVTLRDFCNRDETKIPSYFEIISVIDHHKSNLQTSAPSVTYITDAQSTNAIVAELAFKINDPYSTGGMTLKSIEEQIQKVQKDLENPVSRRIFQRLLTRYNAVLHSQEHPNSHFVNFEREYIEYLHFLYAILDDTDLLTKVSMRDIVCVANLLNRLKTLSSGQEAEIIHFDDIKRDASFVQKAASRILQHPDMYSLYRKIYLAKEKLVDENLLRYIDGKESDLFADTKVQNICCRVGQAKMFANNFNTYEQYAQELRAYWVSQALQYYTDHREVDLHLQMISTIAGAEDLYSGKEVNYSHTDELWFWIPLTEQSIEHLKTFLGSFKASPEIQQITDNLKLEFEGPQAKEISQIFNESFLPVPSKIREGKGTDATLAILRYPAGAINSRKAMISPYLPKLIG